MAHLYNGIYFQQQKDEIIPFVATWMDLEIVILRSKSYRAGEISYDMPYIWNLKGNDTNGLTYKTARDSQTQKTNSWLPGRRKSQGLWEGHVHTAIWITNKEVKMDNQQGPTIQHIEFCSAFCASLDGRRIWGRMDTCICMSKSFHCSSETITTLLIGCTPVQNSLKFGT